MTTLESARDAVIGKARLLVVSHEQAEASKEGPQQDYVDAVLMERAAIKALATAIDRLDEALADARS